MEPSSAASERPESVEEAGALLGATITRCGTETYVVRAPPKGMHSSFATVSPVPGAALLVRLHDLRALLRSCATSDEPLVAAPSLLAVLMKLLAVSTNLAAAASTVVSGGGVGGAAAGGSSGARSSGGGGGNNPASHVEKRYETPPMLSTPLRKLWVDCVVLCHRLGDGLAGSSKIQSTNFVRSMLTLAGTNPRSVKAAGGVRLAALDVTAGLFEDPVLSQKLAPWSFEALQLTLRALRSAGNGEPTYRVLAVRMACATAISCRQASLRTRRLEGRDALVMAGAMDDRATAEAIKLIRQAVTDKFPEVRAAAASFAALLAPLVVPTSGSHQDHGSCLDDIMTIALKHIDDESPAVADGWAEALSRCMSTAVHYNEQVKANSAGDRDVEGGGTPNAGASRSSTASSPFDFDGVSAVRLGARKNAGWLHACSSLKNALSVLVDVFLKAGGEQGATRAGGTFSSGGRAVRVGVSLVLVKLLRLQSDLGCIGEDKYISMKEAIDSILEMLGADMEKQLRPPQSSQSGGAANQLFGSARTWSRADPVLVRLAANRVIREGLSEMASEPIQLGLLQEFVDMLELPDPSTNSDESRSTNQPSKNLNAHQLQVVLVEVSQLLATLGEAAASKVDNLVTRLNGCLVHFDPGVRYEAAIAWASLAGSFPSEGHKQLRRAVDEIQMHHAQLVTLASMGGVSRGETEQLSGLRMFRRPHHKEKKADPTLPYQFAIHGEVLVASMLIKDLAHLPGGLSADTLSMLLSVAEMLVSFQFNETVVSANPGAVCACVRAGFSILSGAMTTGPAAIAPHVEFIFRAWKKCSSKIKVGSKAFGARHDLYCLDSMLSSVVAFLKYDSELLLTIPEALGQLGVLLEEILPLFLPQGRIGSISLTPPVAARLECAKASLLEAFAWLPSGSFPMAADMVFDFAARHIRAAVEAEVSCSILRVLVNREDLILDSKTLSRAKQGGQLGGAIDIESTIVSLTTEVAQQQEREAVLHLSNRDTHSMFGNDDQKFRGSCILGHYARERQLGEPPTPLHEVGTWRQPIDPSRSSKVRLIDAAIQAFSATFGLKSGREQQDAMEMLESLVPPFLAQLARTMGVDTTLIEPDRRSKAKEDSAAVANITAVLLSCLQALPLHEATHNVPIGLGPPWMNKAKDLLLTVLPSASNVVRRAAAEGLALLATLGVSEDAHFLQSTVLHSLDEAMQGNKPDGKPRAIALEPVSAARAGSLFTLACIQRTSFNVAQRQKARGKGRPGNVEDELPVLQMLTRIIPSTGCQFGDYFIVRTYALHSFGVMLAYSSRLISLGEEGQQLVRVGVQLVQENFLSSWGVVGSDDDRGQEAEKLTTEASFLAVLLRLMTLLVPYLHNLGSESPARDFSLMTTLILETHGYMHPVVMTEAMAFFEVLAANQKLLPSHSPNVRATENAMFSCIPFLLDCLTPNRPGIFSNVPWKVGCAKSSPMSLGASIITVRQISQAGWTDVKVVSHLAALLESVSAARHFVGVDLFRSLSAPRELEALFAGTIRLEQEIFGTAIFLLCLECSFQDEPSDRFFRWLLFAKSLLAQTVVATEGEDATDDLTDYSRAGVIKGANTLAAADASLAYSIANPIRWQVKCLAAQLCTIALCELSRKTGPGEPDETHFVPATASRRCSTLCREAQLSGERLPSSLVIFHLEDILSAACMSATATQDQAELRSLQESSMYFLSRLILVFGEVPDPEQPSDSILHQHAPQILSAVKHSLAEEAPLQLFLAGCDALETIVKVELVKDSSALKRVMRTVVLADEQAPFFNFAADSRLPLTRGGEDEEESVEPGSTSAVSPRSIAKLSATGKLLLSRKFRRPSETLESVAKDLIPNEVGLATHLAAMALEGARLLLGSNISLAGTPTTGSIGSAVISCDCGFSYDDIRDISDGLKALIVKNWASYASAAIGPLLAEIASECDRERKEACRTWVGAVVPLLLAGIRDALDACKVHDHERSSAVRWAADLDPAEIGVTCLRGVVLLVREAPVEVLDSQWNADIERIVDMLRDSVILPCLNQNSNAPASQPDAGLPKEVDSSIVTEACGFVKELAGSKLGVESMIESALLVTVLTPLDMLEKGEIQVNNDLVGIIVSSCFSAAANLIQRGPSRDDLVQLMLKLVLSTLRGNGEDCPPSVRDSTRLVIEACLNHRSVSLKQKSETAISLAREHNWEAWSAVSSIVGGIGVSKSFETVAEALRCYSDHQVQLSALSTIRNMVQANEANSNDLADALLQALCGEVLDILYKYGTSQIDQGSRTHRQVACADSTKVMLICYQKMAARDSEDDIVGFLSILFETLLAVVRFNGLPNHPSPAVERDAALGRLCAQAIVHIARTTPTAFKTIVPSMQDGDRTLLEFSVRAELSGYALAGQAPVKKKLDIKTFKS